MRLPNFVGPAYQGQSPLSDPEDLINFYPEVQESAGATARMVYCPTPGLEQRASVPEAPIRAMFDENGRCFFVAGIKFYELAADFSTTLRGTLSAVGPNPATISSNGDGGGQLLITSGDQVDVYDLTTNTLAAVAGVTASQGGMLNGYGLGLDASTSTLYLSDLLDFATWDPTQFAQRSIAPDPWKALGVLYPRIYLFGEHTSEVWYDAGIFPFPFTPVQGILIQEGIEAPFSVRAVGSQLYWLGHSEDGNAVVWRTGGYRPERVSTHAVERALASYQQAGTIADAVAWSYQLDGHEFYLLRFGQAGVTWVYDVSTNLWHKRQTWISEEARYVAWRPSCHTFAFGKHLVGDSETGTIYEMRNRYGLDVEGREIRRVRRTPLLSDEQQWLFFRWLQILLETGLGTSSGAVPQVMLRWSNDGGHTWSDEVWVSAGAVGAYQARVIFRRLGRARNRVFEFVVSDDAPWRITEAYLDVDRGAA